MRSSALFWAGGLAALVTGCSQPGDGGLDRDLDSRRAGARVETESAAAASFEPPSAVPGLPVDCADCVSDAVALDALPESEDAWKSKLTSGQFYILRRGGTEPAYSGEYLKHHADGVYHCAGCNNPLYDSATKYDACGWPSFWDALPGGIATSKDGASAPELICKRCEGHLGHLFDDGPQPTGFRH